MNIPIPISTQSTPTCIIRAHLLELQLLQLQSSRLTTFQASLHPSKHVYPLNYLPESVFLKHNILGLTSFKPISNLTIFASSTYLSANLSATSQTLSYLSAQSQILHSSSFSCGLHPQQRFQSRPHPLVLIIVTPSHILLTTSPKFLAPQTMER